MPLNRPPEYIPEFEYRVTPSMNSTFRDMDHGFLKSRSLSDSVEIRGVEGRHACLELQPVLYRRNLHCKIRCERRCASPEVPACSCTKLKDGYGSFILGAPLWMAGGRLEEVCVNLCQFNSARARFDSYCARIEWFRS
jgi:hypothetical protein